MAGHKKRGYLGRGGSVKGMPPAPNPSSYSSAHQYGTVVNGSGNSQWNRVFEQGNHGNALSGVQGQLSVMPAQKGGKTKRKRGGLFGAVVDQAIVPFGVLALQQSYGRKRSSSKGSKKYYKKRYTKKRSFRRY